MRYRRVFRNAVVIVSASSENDDSPCGHQIIGGRAYRGQNLFRSHRCRQKADGLDETVKLPLDRRAEFMWSEHLDLRYRIPDD
jgi:hypothetical protein